MQFLQIKRTDKLKDLSDRVGERNVPAILALNGLTREVNIGKQFYNKTNKIKSEDYEVDWKRQQAILNELTVDSDAYMEACLQSQSGWRLLDQLSTFDGRLRIPSTMTLPDAADILGTNTHVSTLIYNKSMAGLQKPPHYVDPVIFNEYSSILPSKISDTNTRRANNYDLLQDFNIPRNEIVLYDRLTGDSRDFPAYPQPPKDSRSATYTQMPDILYQYEPWQVYQSSGPRTVTLTFELHRQLWTGNEADGKANELIRFCQSCCYPEYKGSAVNTPKVSLYIAGQNYITGILTDVSVSWDYPISSIDGWYLAFNMDITITEVSDIPLNHTTVRQKSLIS